MCVIIHSLRKKHLKRLEVMAAMKHNNSGFFMCHWPATSTSHEDRKIIRTLNEDEALEFFDGIPEDDVFVMHARIPSKGVVSINNVHGWEEDGVSFCHNMTISSLSGIMTADKWDGTDSEYFFRKLFMPMHKGEHLMDPSLDPSEMGPAAKRLTALLCGETNKFLFIMPDNTVIRAGGWTTIASETRTMVEEREIDEVVGETVDIDGKVTKKTEKVKREISVAREFATAVASNTYYRSSMTDVKKTTPLIGSWDPKTCTYRTPGKKTTYGERYGGYDSDYASLYGDPDPESFYDGEFADTGNKIAKSTGAAGKSKSKKTEASEDDFAKFLAWRKELKDFREVDTLSIKDIAEYNMFSDVETDDDKLTQESIVLIFNMILRCIIYNSYRENIDQILSLDEDAFLGKEDEFGMYTVESENILNGIIPAGFDDTLVSSICGSLSELAENLQFKFSSDGTNNFLLPSEKVQEFLIDMMDAIEGSVGLVNGFDGEVAQLYSPTYHLSCAEICRVKLQAIDNLLNLSFDPTVKANKDVEKYARAALIVGRKLRWIPAPLILSGEKANLTSNCTWEKNKTVDSYISALNFLAEACVTNGESLERADRRYVSDVKSLGFDFDKKGSLEIFTGAESALADDASGPNGKSDSESQSDDKNKDAAGTGTNDTGTNSPAAEKEHEPSILGDPEKTTGGAA